jgi:hypothetical protein
MWRNTAECNGAPGVDDDGDGYVDDCYGINVINHTGDPYDSSGGHGTQLAGIIGAVGNNGIGITGVNWQVQIMTCKGATDDARLILCLDYVKMMKDRGVNIIATNNSYAFTCYDQPNTCYSQSLYDAILTQMNSGILFITVASNEARDNDATNSVYPGNYNLPNIITVAATVRNDNLAVCFGLFCLGGAGSNYGRLTVHVAAPGKDILSTKGNDYEAQGGTSLAAPHVAGLAALLKAQNPSHNWSAIRNLILSTGEFKPSLQGKTVTESRINAYNALTCGSNPFSGFTEPLPKIFGYPMTISAINIDCANPAGAPTVTVTPGGETVPLQDGISPDLASNDGVYSRLWTPSNFCADQLTLTSSTGVSTAVQIGGSYHCSIPSYNWRVIPGANNLNLSDESSATITAPFSVRFGANTYSSVNVGSNGVVSLDSSFPLLFFLNTSLPNNAYNTLIAPFWDDLYPVQGSSQNVVWEWLGSPPNRELVIEWRNVRHYDCSGSSSTTVTFQIVLFENINSVLFNYKDVVFGGSCSSKDYGKSATIGVQVSKDNLFTSAYEDDATQIAYNSQILNNSLAILWTAGTTSGGGTPALFRVERNTGNVFTDGAYYCGLSGSSGPGSPCFNTGIGADVAEHIDVSESVEPGDVVELDPNNSKQYRKARVPYSPSVAGVISTRAGISMANQSNKVGTDSLQYRESRALFECCTQDSLSLSLNFSLARLGPEAILLSGTSVSILAESWGNSLNVKGSRPLLALIGRVPVKATMENGPIRIGDLLTSSSKPGYAMRCSDPKVCEGIVIGKALESLENGEGLILMLIMR